MGAEKNSPWCSLVIVLHCNNNARGALRFHAFCCAIVALDEAQRAIRLVRKASAMARRLRNPVASRTKA